MRYRGSSTNRPVKYILGKKEWVKPLSCPWGMDACFYGKPKCPRFARLRSNSAEVVCLDTADGTGPTFSNVLDVMIDADKLEGKP